MTQEVEIALDDLPVHVLLILGVEGHVASRHLEDEDAHRPPIHGLSVSAVADHLFVAEKEICSETPH